MCKYEYQCSDCEFAVWDCYKEPGYPGALWSFDHCRKEEEISEEEACGEVECHCYNESQPDFPDDPPETW